MSRAPLIRNCGRVFILCGVLIAALGFGINYARAILVLGLIDGEGFETAMSHAVFSAALGVGIGVIGILILLVAAVVKWKGY